MSSMPTLHGQSGQFVRKTATATNRNKGKADPASSSGGGSKSSAICTDHELEARISQLCLHLPFWLGTFMSNLITTAGLAYEPFSSYARQQSAPKVRSQVQANPPHQEVGRCLSIIFHTPHIQLSSVQLCYKTHTPP